MARYTNINTVIELINGLFDESKKPLKPIPSSILLNSKIRPGVDYKDISSNILTRQSQAGIKTGKIFSKSENKAELMEIIRIEEIINHLILNGKIEIVIPAGTQITGTITTPTPAPFVGTTTKPTKGFGILR